ncbi:hypothetical protein EV361DRAFT_608730 [Lentinula raphanica]|nr:hypothetical protein EV361DRAFT_608730 [Lentinula raphanica]
MPTALASQLASQASQNAQIVLDRSRTRGKHASVESYLFANARDAAEYDLDAVFALGRSGFEALMILNPRISVYEDSLLSYHARNVDRTLLNPEATRELDAALEGCLKEMGAYLMEGSASKVLEWLVRRFRINEFNIRALVSLFLPYHETYYWGKMLSILHLNKDPILKFLVPYQKQAQKPTSQADLVLSRKALVQAMLQHGDVARLVVRLLGEALKGPKDGSFSGGKLFRTLVAFWAATIHDFILAHGSNGAKGMSEGTSVLVFAAVIEPLSVIPKVKAKMSSRSGNSKSYDGAERDAILTSYILLAALSSRVPHSLSSAALKVILSSMIDAAAPGSSISAQHLVKTLVAVCATQNELVDSDVSEDMLDKLLAVPHFLPEFVSALGLWDGAEKVLGPFLEILVTRLTSSDAEKASQALRTLETVLVSTSPPPPTTFIHRITTLLLRSSCHFATAGGIHSLLSILHQRYLEVLTSARDELNDVDDLEEADLKKLDELIMSLSLGTISAISSASSSNLRDALLASSSANSNARVSGVKILLDLLQNADNADLESISEALLSRVIDTDVPVLETLYDSFSRERTLCSIVLSTKDNATRYVALVQGVLFPAPPSPGVPPSEAIKPPERAVVRAHLAFIIQKLASATPDWDTDWANTIFLRFIFPYILYSKPRGKTADVVWDLLEEAGKSHPWITQCTKAMSSVGEEEEAERFQRLNAALTGQIASNIVSSQSKDLYCTTPINMLTDTNQFVRVLSLLIIRAILKISDTPTKVALQFLDVLGRQDDLPRFPDVEDGLEDTLSTKIPAQVVSKPTSRTTEGLLYLAILSDIAALQPSGTKSMDTVEWAQSESQHDTYAALLQQLYHYVITTINAGQAKVFVLRVLFTNLGPEAGVFLTNVWLRSDRTSDPKALVDEDITPSWRTSTLCHLAAFLEAHTSTTPGKAIVDFQTLLPTIVIALSSPAQESRKAAISCLTSIKALVADENGKGRKFDLVYAFDRVYGIQRSDADLQYLSPDDLATYVSALFAVREHFLADRDYIGAWHAEQFPSGDHNQEKHSIKYRTHILCYLLSHINALSILAEAQAELLRVVLPCFIAAQQRFSNRAKKHASRNGKKTHPEAVAALLLLPFLHSIVNAKQKETKKDKKGRTISSNWMAAAKLGVKAVFSDPGILELDDDYKGSKPWTLLCGLLTRAFGDNDTFVALRPVLSECTTRIWTSAVLRKDQRIELANVVLDAAVAADSKAQMGVETVSVKTLLGRLLGLATDDQAQVIITLLNKCCKAVGQVTEGAESALEPKSKKARVEPSGTDSNEGKVTPFHRLSTFAEVLASLSFTSVAESTTKPIIEHLPHSFELIPHLLDTLSQLVQFHASGVSVSSATSIEFACQNIMSSIDYVATGIRDPPNFTPTPIRLDVLVDIIRLSANPQTIHQALLLIAGLARLAPDSVLRNVMPVFTFMGIGAVAMTGGGSKTGIEIGGGTTMLSRDDGYGLGIVQKTVDSIVPVMVSSLKRSHPSGGLDLHIAAREFLRVFTDAANHIPRHRRNNFFSHLVTVLGPKDFLTPVCLLLIEKSANKIARSQQYLLGTNKAKGKDRDSDVQNILALPTALIHHFEPWLQALVLTEMLRESERLLERAKFPDAVVKNLLDDSSLEEHSVSAAVVFRRRAQAIITFVGFAAKTFPTSNTPRLRNPDDINISQSEDNNYSDVVSILISLSTTSTSGSDAETKIQDAAKSARLSLARVLNVMSAASFIDTVAMMLSSDDDLIQEGALSLVSTRLPRVSASVRQSAVSSVVNICGLVQRILDKNPNQSTTTSAFNAIRAIGTTLCSGEESAVSTLVPFLVGAVNVKSSPEVVTAAVQALITLPARLGPRLIAHFRDIVARAVPVLREGSEGLIKDVVQLLHNLLTAIPTFWSTVELTNVIKLYLDISLPPAKPPQELSNFIKAIAKKAPSKVLLPTLCDIWRSLQIAPTVDALIGYFDLLKRSFRAAARPVIQENLRAVFSLFLDAFSIVKGSLELSKANSQVISAFVELVVKLNEPMFRPLFRKLYDWAFAGASDVPTKIMFCHVYIGLLDYFKGLMNPYMTMLLTPFTEILQEYSNEKTDNKDLLPPVLEILGKSLACDDGSFWRDDKVKQISSMLISQIPICVKLNILEAKSLLQDCLVAGAETATDDRVLKLMNLDILMHTRSEDAKIRLFALTCAEALWRAHGSKLLGFVAETATFVAECCEDENDLVTRESFKLKDAVEGVAGSINAL